MEFVTNRAFRPQTQSHKEESEFWKNTEVVVKVMKNASLNESQTKSFKSKEEKELLMQSLFFQLVIMSYG